MAIIRGIEGEKEKALVELWDSKGIVMAIPTEDTHGSVCSPVAMGYVGWKPIAGNWQSRVCLYKVS